MPINFFFWFGSTFATLVSESIQASKHLFTRYSRECPGKPKLLVKEFLTSWLIDEAHNPEK